MGEEGEGGGVQVNRDNSKPLGFGVLEFNQLLL